MEIEFDQDKRDKTLQERGLDFARAGEVFASVTVTIEDIRREYGETRYISIGLLDLRAVILALDATRQSPPQYFDEVCQ